MRTNPFDQLVTDLLPLCRRIGESAAVANGMHRRAVDADDLAQDLAIELLSLLRSWDPARCEQRSDLHGYLTSFLLRRAAGAVRSYSFVKRAGLKRGLRTQCTDHPDWDTIALASVKDAGPSPQHVYQLERTFRRWLLGHLTERQDRLFATLRWWRGWKTTELARLFDRHDSWASLKQAAVRDVMMRALGRPELVGARCAQWNAPDPLRELNRRAA